MNRTAKPRRQGKTISRAIACAPGESACLMVMWAPEPGGMPKYTAHPLPYVRMADLPEQQGREVTALDKGETAVEISEAEWERYISLNSHREHMARLKKRVLPQ